MAHKMAISRFLPGSWKGCRSGSGAYHTVSRALRSTQESTNAFDASPDFTSSLAKPIQLPGLFRRVLSSQFSKHNEKRSSSHKTGVTIYADESTAVPYDKLFEEISRDVQQPDNGGLLSTLHYSYGLAKVVLSAWPPARLALIENGMTGATPKAKRLRSWTIRGVLSSQDLQSSTNGIPSFTLRIATSMEGVRSNIRPHAATSDTQSRLNMILNLHLRSKVLPPVAPLGESADKSTQPVDDLVNKLVDDLWSSLHGRQFTSVVCWHEAVVMHLKESFGRSKFDQYLELENMRVVSERDVQRGLTLRWIHEPPSLKASLQAFSLGNSSLTQVLKLRHNGSPQGIEDETEVATMAFADEKSGDNVKTVLHPYTLNISVASKTRTKLTPSAIALNFKQIYARSTARDLPSMLDSFLAVSQSLPTNITDPINVRISRDSPNVSTSPADSSSWPTHSVELKKGTATGSVKVSMRTDLQRSFQLRFNKEELKNRQIQVKGIRFQISPIDAAAVESLLNRHLSEQVSMEQEINNLASNAATTVYKVCEGVKFEDITTVPGYLAEAVLRVVRPLTAGFVLESVSMDVVVGDDLVILTKTVSIADLEARIRHPERYLAPMGRVELPSGYQATVSHHLFNLPSRYMEKTGFKHLKMDLLSHPVTDYESTSIYREVVENFHRGLKASQIADCYALQAIVCNALKELPGGDGLAMQLVAPCSPLPDEIVTPEPCQITVFSDGEIVCVLEPFSLTSVMLQDSRGRQRVRVQVQLTWRGTPNQQLIGYLNVKQQMDLMREVLGPKLNAELDGYVISHSHWNDLADKVAEKVLEARFEFPDHFDINTVSALLAISEADQTHTEPAEQDDVRTASADCSARKDVAGIKALLHELDSKLLSITTTSSDIAITSDEITRSVQLDSNANNRGQMQRGVVIALGSNVGNRVEEIEKACRAIDADPDMRIVATSFLYETKPMYVEDQERFVNGACEIETSLTPIQLLDRLQAIEQGHGRVKLVDKGPRNIDLDIAIFRDEVVETERLTVPHLLMHEREFVLRPIMDLTAMRQWRNPRSKTVLSAMFGHVLNPKINGKASGQITEPMHVVTPLTTGAMIYPLDPCRKTLVMSILNTTPDSFSDGGSNTLDPQSLRKTAAAHIAAGATIIDVGGQSSRPNAPDVTAEEEINRVLPAIAAIKSLPEAEGIAISVDTYRASVAEAAVNAGAHIVNDISAGMLDPQMFSTVARLGCTYIMMHMRGTPATMQSPENCTYRNLRNDITDELGSRVALAIEAGVRTWRIIVDPGIGFAKTQAQNISLLRLPLLPQRNPPPTSPPVSSYRQSEKRLLRMPQLVGCSRKGFIGNITGVAEPKDRVHGTAAAVTASIHNGADIVRVHDVQEMVHVTRMADAIYRSRGNPR